MILGPFTGLTHTGRKRRHNEDAFVLRPPLFAVADGMGGAQAGEIASRIATEALMSEDTDGGGVERVVGLVQSANRRVYERSREDSAVSGMGTTMTVALVEDGNVTIGHVGDSRAYLIRDGRLAQLTEDHSLVQELIRSGKLTPEEAEHHPQRSVITRALGTDPDVDVDTYTVEPQPDDVFLLCSDGLTSMVGDDVILRIVEEHRTDLDEAARQLVASANKGGGEDNITVVFFAIAPEGDTAPAPAAAPRREPTPAADDEDTLSGIERVPAVQTVVVPVKELGDLRNEPPPEPEPGGEGGSGGTRALVFLGVLALLGTLAVLVLWGLSS